MVVGTNKLLALLCLLGLLTLLIGARKPARTSFDALVIKVDGSSLVLSAADEKHFKRVAVQTDDQTQVLIDGKPGALSDLKPAQRVIVSPRQGTARKVEKKEPRQGKPPESGLMDGAVQSAGSGRLLLYAPLSSGEIARVEVATGDKTVVVVDGKSATVGDLKPDTYIEIAFVGGKVRRIVVQSQETK